MVKAYYKSYLMKIATMIAMITLNNRGTKVIFYSPDIHSSFPLISSNPLCFAVQRILFIDSIPLSVSSCL